ncbi:putative copper resistance protein D [Mycetocola sp. BIGb0189]|uniref:bifunctional copper resistance protein CopD/cytochrome c oxidase assembly protein n=1 Tax=Mycetocola sp. BIGb0189 TaxID=2940604 RepID=UPI0021670CE3|nr:bifunctional copper resistance protein CopD/cytochrome c oxidase assembly protein [Mycetocola sp. BIGb0189]MCS4277179.1 putative copper resistance protein D [Mycetocola sp. BIGb0189]
MSRVTRIVAPAVLLLIALIALFGALAIGGGAQAQQLSDPGATVRYGLPIAKMIVNISAAGMIGALTLVLFALTPQRREYGAALDVASASAALFTIASGATGVLTFLNVTGTKFELTQEFGSKIGVFFTDVEAGRAWLITTLIAAAVTVLCFSVRGQTLVFFVGVLAAFSLLPMAQQGHAAGTSGHGQAVTALGLHLLFAGVWLGGLLTLVFIRSHLERGRLPIVLARYSTLALVCFVVVAISGYASAALRVGSLEQLLTPYGLLVVLKGLSLVVLGLFGATYRLRMIDRLEKRGKNSTFWWIVVAELAFMGIASGVAAALGRTATPVLEDTSPTRTPAELLTGDKLPPELTPWRLFTLWEVDLIWLLVGAFGIFFYLAGMYRLHKRGDKWPWLRAVSWIAGLLLLMWITSGGINVYQRFLFSTHMMGHMALTMAVPVLLVPGAPVTLAMRAIRKRQDGSRGAREWILTAVHSRFATIITNPVVTAVLFAGSLWVFYYTEIFRWSMVDHIGHEWMIIHFVITGYLFVQSLIGIDPVPHRLAYPMRLILLIATMAFHAFFGLAIMSNTGLFVADWFGATGRTWGDPPMEDQRVGGGITWSIGEIPTVALAIAVAIQWSRNDVKEQRRSDRRADRSGDAELKAYNARLAKMAEREDAGK